MRPCVGTLSTKASWPGRPATTGAAGERSRSERRSERVADRDRRQDREPSPVARSCKGARGTAGHDRSSPTSGTTTHRKGVGARAPYAAMFDTILGLPVHALVVHFVVVLVPLAALGVIAIAVVPAWRARFGLLVLAVATAALVSVPVAVLSGRQLLNRINASGTTADQINNHMKMAKLVIYPTAAMWVLAVLLYWFDRKGRAGGATKVVL